MSWYGLAQKQLVFPLPQFVTTSIPNATVGTPYTTHISVTNISGPLVFTVSGSTGNWLSINSSGFLSGTPSVADTETITVNVTDGRGMSPSAPASFTLIVVSGSQTLPNAQVGVAYSQQLPQGTAPYTSPNITPNWLDWASISSGGLVTGTPLNDETETIVIIDSTSTQFTFTLVVSPQ